MRILFALLVLFALPVQAETITISNDACAYATAHAPDSDVLYQPGVDADGNWVAPADLPPAEGGGIMLEAPKNISIPLSLDLQNSLHLPNRYSGTDALVGTVDFVDGQLYFNGTPLSQNARNEIIAACRQHQATAKPAKKPNILLGE